MLEVKNQQITELQRGTPQRGQTRRRHAQARVLVPELERRQLSQDQQTEVKKQPTFKRINTEMEKGTKSTSCNA